MMAFLAGGKLKEGLDKWREVGISEETIEEVLGRQIILPPSSSNLIVVKARNCEIAPFALAVTGSVSAPAELENVRFEWGRWIWVAVVEPACIRLNLAMCTCMHATQTCCSLSPCHHSSTDR